jgi:hypothetical protein
MAIVAQQDSKYRGITFNQTSEPGSAEVGDTWIDDNGNTRTGLMDIY